MGKLPIACELTPAEITARRDTLLPGLLAQAVEQIPLPYGFRWRFAASGAFLATAAAAQYRSVGCSCLAQNIVSVILTLHCLPLKIP